MSKNRHILVTGATGYIGGRLVPRLLEEDYQVHVLVRDIARIGGRFWAEKVKLHQGDVFKPETLTRAMQGVEVAYYFIHSLYAGSDFHQKDLIAARNFSNAALKTGVKRIIYLGGLGDPQTKLSEHLRSRQKAGEVLRETGVSVTEFRAAIIVGSGSASFEMIRYLSERIPLMICPRWVFSQIQPIAIKDVMAYLVAALETPESAGRIIEIGGADILTYADTMLEYSRIRGLKRFILPVPVLSPGLSSHWVHWVTPVSARIARPLIEGLRNQVIVKDDSARHIFPGIKPMGYREAVKLALSNLKSGQVETAWTDALISSQGENPPTTLTSQEGIMIKRWQLMVETSPQAIYRIFTTLGGQKGWLYANGAWQLRGFADCMVGGVGLRRGRRHPDELRVGDALDFWRVERLELNHLLRLRSEMRAPGQLWLQFEVHPQGNGKAFLVETLFYAPRGLWGLLYWYIFYPLHVVFFSGLITKLTKRAKEII